MDENWWLAADSIDWNDCELGACTCEGGLIQVVSTARNMTGDNLMAAAQHCLFVICCLQKCLEYHLREQTRRHRIILTNTKTEVATRRPCVTCDSSAAVAGDSWMSACGTAAAPTAL